MRSLRRDIHSALEVIEPSLGGMPERVVQTVLTDKRRRRKEKVTYRLRISFTLVAAVLMVAVAAAAIVTWNSLRTNIAPAGSLDQTTIQQLEARPLQLPAFASTNVCKSGPQNSDGSFGSGPLFRSPVTSSWNTSWGRYYDYDIYTDVRITGPVLVRARDLFTRDAIVFVGPYAAGPIVGSDVFDGPKVTQRPEAVFDASQATATVDFRGAMHAFVWRFIAGAATDSSGSSGWQIDGINFSETFAVC